MVQGLSAPEQIVRALEFFNQKQEVDVIAILRGGGSADDLAAFNDELLVRAVASSRIPIITGIGHEIDESLCDLAADVRASTPSNAAERLSPDRRQTWQQIETAMLHLPDYLLSTIIKLKDEQLHKVQQLTTFLEHKIDSSLQHLSETTKVLASVNPETVLQRGYAIIRGKLSPGEIIKVSTYQQEITAEVTNVKARN